MKKIIALVIAIVMMAAISVPAFAANLSTESNSGNVTMTYEVSGAWTVAIPEDFSLNESGTKTVTASNCFLNNGETLTVTVNSADGFKMMLGGTNTEIVIAYTVNGETAGPVEVLSVASGLATKEATVTFATTGTIPNVAGTYSDVLSFTVAVGSAG